jgi:long-subunit fatty acid transport protein
MFIRQFSTLILASVLSASAFAAGYEKNIMWSGRHGGVAGAGAAWAMGPEALYYNPAGILTKAGDRSATANVSLVTSQFKAPVTTTSGTVDAEREYYAVPAFFYGASPTDKFGYAVGLYAAGGSRAHFGNVNVGVAGYTPTLKSEIDAVELSVGGGYEVMNDLKVGAAYRFGLVSAAFSSAAIVGGGPTVLVVDVNKLEGHQQGFRLGAQYAPEGKRYGAGISYRSPLHLSLGGDAKAEVRGGATMDGSAPVTVKTIFPTQISTGFFYDVVPEAWRAHLEHVWTQYSRNQKLVVDGFAIPAALGIGTDVPDIEQHWRDQHNIRVAGEYLKSKYPIRFGYVWSSGVENSRYARAIFAAPSVAHTFTVGTGRGNEKWDFNVAAEYIMVEADANPIPPAAGTAVGSNTGHYETDAISLHTGVTYKF